MNIYRTKLYDLDVLVMDSMADHRSLEPSAIYLLNHVSALLRHTMSQVAADLVNIVNESPVPEGPYFVYDQAPDIFGGRTGQGPLKVAWDTNVLLDYFQYGERLWAGDSPPDIGDEKYVSELECLQLIVGLWTLRDIRFRILPATIADAKRRLSDPQRRVRLRAFDEFAHALELVSSDEDDTPSHGLLYLPDSQRQVALRSLSGGWDRILVSQAIDAGEHVFLTRDEKILHSRSKLRPFGLTPATPGDLLEWLFACGAFNCLLTPRCAYWPLMDTQRAAHLIRALGR